MNKDKNATPDTRKVFIEIENQYTWASHVTFPLSKLEKLNLFESYHALHASLGKYDFIQDIQYEKFLLFLAWMFQELNKMHDQYVIFQFVITEPGKCKWRVKTRHEYYSPDGCSSAIPITAENSGPSLSGLTGTPAPSTIGECITSFRKERAEDNASDSEDSP